MIAFNASIYAQAVNSLPSLIDGARRVLPIHAALTTH
jgi:hypothetical protein